LAKRAFEMGVLDSIEPASATGDSLFATEHRIAGRANLEQTK